MESKQKVENRFDKIRGYGKNRALEASRKTDFEAKAVACLKAQIRSLQPSIEALIQTANACLENGICIDRSGDSLDRCYDTYEKGTFFTNGISHRLGFVHAPMSSKKQVVMLGIDAGGICGEWNFRTNGKDIYSQYQQQTSTRREPQRKHLEQFLNSFEEFETAFYAYVDKIVGAITDEEATVQDAPKKLIFRNEHGIVELDDFAYDKEFHAYWGGICQCCYSKYGKILENNIDDGGGSGVCSVKGCNNDAYYYADFMEDVVKICDNTDSAEAKETLNAEQFMAYLTDNFAPSEEVMRFIGNIVEYAAEMFDDPTEAKQFLKTMFAGTIGITENELELLVLSKEEPCD